MNWKWEEMTAPVFDEAVKTTKGVCIVPLGVIEKHGDHLPLGTDLMFVRSIAEQAAQKEPAVIFPPYYLTQIHEAKHCPGTVAIRISLMMDLLDNVCDEIARNCFRKSLLLNGHGGNESWRPAFACKMLEHKRDFTLYIGRLVDYWGPTLEDPEWKKMMVTSQDLHGGEVESSIMLAVRPDLVDMNAVKGPAGGLKRLAHLPSLLTPIWWYSDAPDHYCGDARPATREKGQFLMERLVPRVAALIKAVKDDQKAPELEKEYFSKIRH